MEFGGIEEFIQKYKPHLKELKSRLVILAYVFAFFFFISLALAKPLTKFIFKYFGSADNIWIVVDSPVQFFSVAFDLSIFMAIIATFPLALYFIYSFLRPALQKREKKIAVKIAFVSLFFFFFGFAFGLVVMYYAIISLAGFNAEMGLLNMWNMGIVISQILLASALFGLYFQYPLILTILIRLGVINVDMLRRKRRVMTAVTVIVISVLPPPEVVATIAMIIPILLLYELTIIVNRKYGTKKVEVPQDNQFNLRKKYV